MNCLVDLHLQASSTYLSLDYYFSHNHVVLEDVGHFFNELADKKREGAKHLLKIQSQLGGHILFQDVRKSFQDEWTKFQDTLKATLGLEKNFTPWVLPTQTLISVASWRPLAQRESQTQEDGQPPNQHLAESEAPSEPRLTWASISSKVSP